MGATRPPSPFLQPAKVRMVFQLQQISRKKLQLIIVLLSKERLWIDRIAIIGGAFFRGIINQQHFVQQSAEAPQFLQLFYIMRFVDQQHEVEVQGSFALWRIVKRRSRDRQQPTPRTDRQRGVPIVARTFHALAYDIIGMVEGSKPALADHATDDAAFTAMIKHILKDLVHTLSEVPKAIIPHFLVEPKTEWDFETKHAYYTHMEQQDLRTLQGEKAKNYEELQIANWLYENGVECEYEPAYEHKVSENERRD